MNGLGGAWPSASFPADDARNDLRFAAGELSGGGGSVTLRVNNVLLHYLPPVRLKCPF